MKILSNNVQQQILKRERVKQIFATNIFPFPIQNHCQPRTTTADDTELNRAFRMFSVVLDIDGINSNYEFTSGLEFVLGNSYSNCRQRENRTLQPEGI